MKIKISLLALLLLCSSIAFTTQASAKNSSKQLTEIRVMEIKQRVEQIRDMDLNHLNKAERHGLRLELKGMKTELRNADPVIYISAGALILIIIILILVL